MRQAWCWAYYMFSYPTAGIVAIISATGRADENSVINASRTDTNSIMSAPP